MILLLGSELSSEVDTPAEVDTNSLSISAAAYFAFNCLFLAAFYFWCKLCSWPWKLFLSSLGRAEMYSGSSMKGFTQSHTLSHRDPYQSIFKICWKYINCKVEMSAWMLSRIWELKLLKALDPPPLFFFSINCWGFFIVPLDIFRICPKWWSLCFDTLMIPEFLFGMRDF